jgi:hypothetical protein
VQFRSLDAQHEVFQHAGAFVILRFWFMSMARKLYAISASNSGGPVRYSSSFTLDWPPHSVLMRSARSGCGSLSSPRITVALSVLSTPGVPP